MAEMSTNTKIGVGLAGAGGALAVAFITIWEGFLPVAIHDPIDPPGINTVCFGHIEDVKVGDRYTKEECQEMLAADLPRYDAQVWAAIKVPLPPHRYAAILSFTYNLGGGALARSNVARQINAGNIQAGCDAMLQYVYANGKFVQGLLNRRKAEREWCLRED